MRMSSLEKIVVNSLIRSRSVARTVQRRFEALSLCRGARVLEVGCGNGAAAIRLVDTFGFSVTGLDVDPAQVAAARARIRGRNLARFVVADAGALPFRDRSFEAVTTNMTLHHVPRWRDALEEMSRVLEPGGIFVFGDLVTPSWTGAGPVRWLGKRIGVQTLVEIEGFFDSSRFRLLHRIASPFHFEASAEKRAP
jgi:ubiquinone/menaquinone biosynthesis C-methylase UbiE